jgi:hypothetical protein
MSLRGASEEEVVQAVRTGQWTPAKWGKMQTRHTFDFNSLAQTNMRLYKFKIVEPIFADEDERIVIVTVKVYYSNAEETEK